MSKEVCFCVQCAYKQKCLVVSNPKGWSEWEAYKPNLEGEDEQGKRLLGEEWEGQMDFLG